MLSGIGPGAPPRPSGRVSGEAVVGSEDPAEQLRGAGQGASSGRALGEGLMRLSLSRLCFQLVAAIVFVSFGVVAAFCCAIVDGVFAARHIVSSSQSPSFCSQLLCGFIRNLQKFNFLLQDAAR